MYRIKNGYIISENSINLHETLIAKYNLQSMNDTFKKNYDFNDIVSYSCHPGYKFQNNHNLLNEFKLQCSENGTWIGFVPDCVPLNCPWPKNINNGKLLFKTRDNETIELLEGKTVSTNMNAEISLEDDIIRENRNLIKQFVIGSEILIKCDIGYKLIGNRSKICTDNEEWSSMLSYCELQECPFLNHPLFQILNKEINPNNHTIWKNGRNKKLYNDTHENFEVFVEGDTYMKKIVLSCNNNGKIKFNNKNIHNSISNLTWICNEHAKWQIIDTELNDTIIKILFNNGIDNICQTFMCALVTVSNAIIF